MLDKLFTNEEDVRSDKDVVLPMLRILWTEHVRNERKIETIKKRIHSIRKKQLKILRSHN